MHKFSRKTVVVSGCIAVGVVITNATQGVLNSYNSIRVFFYQYIDTTRLMKIMINCIKLKSFKEAFLEVKATTLKVNWSWLELNNKGKKWKCQSKREIKCHFFSFSVFLSLSLCLSLIPQFLSLSLNHSIYLPNGLSF